MCGVFAWEHDIMQTSLKKKYYALIISLFLVANAHAATPYYFMEFGLMGGTSYYIGDTQKHIFMNPRYTGGAMVNVKFDRRWSVTAKAQYIDIAYMDGDTKGGNQIIHADLTAEFNFFQFDIKQYDPKIKPVTPYIFLGIGFSMYGNKFGNSAPNIPFGFGVKWKMAPRWTLNLAWQHQMYFFFDADNLENKPKYDDTYDLNKTNFLRNDMVSTLTLGITFAFIPRKPPCNCCE